MNLIEQLSKIVPQEKELTLSTGKILVVPSVKIGFFTRLSTIPPMPHPWSKEATLSITDAFFLILNIIHSDSSLSTFQQIFLPFIGFINGTLLCYFKGLTEDEITELDITDLCKIFLTMYEVNKPFFSLFLTEKENLKQAEEV